MNNKLYQIAIRDMYPNFYVMARSMSEAEQKGIMVAEMKKLEVPIVSNDGSLNMAIPEFKIIVSGVTLIADEVY